MSSTICLCANSFYYPKGGGHFWVYLNWALGFVSNGYKIIWLECVKRDTPHDELNYLLLELKKKLEPYHLGENIALVCNDGSEVKLANTLGIFSADEAGKQSDILVNQVYSLPEIILGKFRRKILIDIDPGLLQVWIAKRQIIVAPHDMYFTIGETVGLKNSNIPTAGITWNYIPPCVSLEHWQSTSASRKNPAFTTVSHWSMDEWEEQDGTVYNNDKRSGFNPYLGLPSLTDVPLELALLFGSDIKEKQQLEEMGWRIKHSHLVTGTPTDYKNYIQGSLGEFSCVKPSCVFLQNAWVSDRSLCYLASGKPVIIQHTGKSKILPDNAGMFRFRNILEAKDCLEKAMSEYDKQCNLARKLAEEFFDAKKVTAQLLESML